jgi:hypothetical protein
MSAQQGALPGDPSRAGEPTEEEMRAAYEAELQRLTATDMIAQATVSLLNIGAYRMGPPADESGVPVGSTPGDGRDLEQVRDAVDGARALLEILERRMPGELGPLRDALSRLQMAYAREVQAAPADTQPVTPASQPAQEPQAPAAGAPEQPGDPSGPGPAESSGRLWVPGR